jgi:putative ATPase
MADLFADDLPPAAHLLSRRRCAACRPLAPARNLEEVVGQGMTGRAPSCMVAAGKLSSPSSGDRRAPAKPVSPACSPTPSACVSSRCPRFSGVGPQKCLPKPASPPKPGERTVLFLDEIHRFNRAQQDILLGDVEAGYVILVGATTENPSFELNAALLSRCQVLILYRLDHEALCKLLDRAEALVGRPLPLTPEARDALVASADGDGRFVLNQSETLFDVKLDALLDPSGLASFLQRRVAVYDKDREGHYNLISALHKSLRGSDPQAALYISRENADRR